MICLHAALVCQENVTHEDNCGMSDQGIEIPALNFLGQFQVLFCHFEKNLDVPAFAVDANDVVVGQVSEGWTNLLMDRRLKRFLK